MPMLYAVRSRAMREKYAAFTASQRAEAADVNSKPFTDKGRAQLLQPIEQYLLNTFEDFKREFAPILDAASKRWQGVQPAAQQRAKALKNPEKAAAYVTIAARAGLDELRALALVAKQDGDLLAAYGVRRALDGSDDDVLVNGQMSAVDPGRDAILTLVNETVSDDTLDALADLVGARVEYGRFLGDGPWVDSFSTMVASPAQFLVRADEMRAIPGLARTLTEEEAEVYCVRAGVPQRTAA